MPFADSNPAVADQIGKSLARSLAKKVDAAFFGNTVTNGPSGLLSLSGVNVVDTGTVTLDSLDAFHQAKADALADGAELSVFILAPDVALSLSQAKQATGSNLGLLESTGVGDGVTLAGVPVLVSTDVAAGNAWGLDGSQVLVVQRTGTKVIRSTDAAFDYDAVQVRATARVSFGVANPAGVVLSVPLYDDHGGSLRHFGCRRRFGLQAFVCTTTVATYGDAADGGPRRTERCGAS